MRAELGSPAWVRYVTWNALPGMGLDGRQHSHYVHVWQECEDCVRPPAQRLLLMSCHQSVLPFTVFKALAEKCVCLLARHALTA